MTFVVTESCIACRYGECVSVCPQHAIHEGPNFVVINPETCANCGLCEMVCPVNAIFPPSALKPDQRKYVEINAELAKVWPVAKDTPPLDEAEANAFEQQKFDRLVR